MNIYHIRTTQDDYATLIALGKTLGAIEETETGVIVATQAGCWDYIGAIYEPTGTSQIVDGISVPDMAPLLDPLGHEYLHINLLTPINLKETAVALATEHPEIASGLSDLGRYFLLDAEGNARAPAAPQRVFAGA